MALVALFWALAVWNVERFPPLHNDEPWILAPGYQLVTRGVYGVDMLAGVANMDAHYLEFLPLFPVLQGLAARFLGLGVFQLRYGPAVLGTLTVALTFGLGRRMFSERVGVWGALLLVGWRWASGLHPYFGSGVALLDIARLGRYDILVAPLGLAAAWAAWRAHRTGRARDDCLSGMLAGLAGLAHLYGLVWVAVVVVWRWLEPVHRGVRLKRTLWVLGGAGAAWLPWLLIIARYWDDFAAQQRAVNLRPAASGVWARVASSFVHEPDRYLLALRDPASYGRPGVWLLLAMAPLALLWLARETRGGDPERRWAMRAWLAATVMFPLALTLLPSKNFGYLATVAPLWAVAVAGGLSRLRGQWGAWARWALVLVLVDGAAGAAHLQGRAARRPSATAILQQVRALTPPGRVMGPATTWLALADRDYHYNLTAYLWANPVDGAEAMTYAAAFDRLDPQVVVVEGPDTRPSGWTDPGSTEGWVAAIYDYVHQPRAHLVGEVVDAAGGRVAVYWLEGR